MPKKPPATNAIAFDEAGRPFASGDEAAAGEASILEDPEATPVLLVAMLHGKMAIRVFGPPSAATAYLLDQIAATYRKALDASTAHPAH